MKKFVIASLPAEMYGQSPVKILREFMARKIVCYAISADELAEMNMRDSHACVSIPVQGLNELGYSTFECAIALTHGKVVKPTAFSSSAKPAKLQASFYQTPKRDIQWK